MKRYAVYARFSNEKQSETSAKDQINRCRKKIETDNGIIFDTYKDEAESGAITKRDGFDRLQEDAKERKFDVIYAEALDRFSRDQEHIAKFYKIMKYHDIEVRTLTEGKISEIHIGLTGTMNALDLIKLSQRVSGRMEEYAEQGFNMSNRPYGYDVIYEMDKDGNPVLNNSGRRARGRLKVNFEESEIVHLIFVKFNEGMSPRGIAQYLNDKGVPGPKGKKWTDSMIRGRPNKAEGILNNPIYIGIRLWGKTFNVRDPETGKNKLRWKPRNEWKEYEMPDLAFISENLWKSVKAKQEAVLNSVGKDPSKNPLNPRRRPKYLLSGKMECGVCGSNFNLIGSGACSCSNAVRGKGCKNNGRIRYSTIQNAVLLAIIEKLLAPDKVDLFVKAYTEEYQGIINRHDAERNLIQSEAKSIEGKINSIIYAMERGIITDTTRKRLLELEKIKAENQTKQDKMVDLPCPKKADVRKYRKKVLNLADSLSDKEISSAANEAIRPFISRVVITPTDKGWHGVMRGKVGVLVGIRDCPDTDIILRL